MFAIEFGQSRHSMSIYWSIYWLISVSVSEFNKLTLVKKPEDSVLFKITSFLWGFFIFTYEVCEMITLALPISQVYYKYQNY